jgi:hypothetical protein
MQSRTRDLLDCFQRVEEFLTQHPLPEAAAALGEQAATLHDVVTRLTSDFAAQVSGKNFVGVHVKSAIELRHTLYAEHLMPISRLAREVFGSTGFGEAFRMPARRASNQQLIASAQAFADAAVQQKDTFVRHGLPGDFIEQLKASADALGGARMAKKESVRVRITATKGSMEQGKRGRQAVRLLNAILQVRLRKEPELLTAWNAVRRPRAKSDETLAPVPDIAPVKAA